MNVSDEVIAVCAVNATLRTRGVAEMEGGIPNALSKNLLGRELLAKGVKVNQTEEGVETDVFIKVEYRVGRGMGYTGKRKKGDPVHDRSRRQSCQHTRTGS